MLLYPVLSLLLFVLALSLLDRDLIPFKHLSLQTQTLLFSISSLSDVIISRGLLIICLILLWAQEQFLD